ARPPRPHLEDGAVGDVRQPRDRPRARRLVRADRRRGERARARDAALGRARDRRARAPRRRRAGRARRRPGHPRRALRGRADRERGERSDAEERPLTADEIVETRERLLESVEQNERELRQAVDELASAAHARIDLGERMSERPWGWLAAAAAIGLWM